MKETFFKKIKLPIVYNKLFFFNVSKQNLKCLRALERLRGAGSWSVSLEEGKQVPHSFPWILLHTSPDLFPLHCHTRKPQKPAFQILSVMGVFWLSTPWTMYLGSLQPSGRLALTPTEQLLSGISSFSAQKKQIPQNSSSKGSQVMTFARSQVKTTQTS